MSSSQAPRGGRIRPRPVSFGNPALGTYGGCVYTVEQTGFWDEDTFVPPKGALTAERVVAMVNVPPEQVPEGILNFARSHRRFIELVRIVISSPGRTDSIAPTETASATKQSLEMPALSQQLAALNLEGTNTSHRNVLPSPSVSAMENAASILAADEELEAKATLLEANVEEQNDNDDEDDKALPSRTYIVLLELSTAESASTFVNDLNGKPYNSLEEDVTCSVHHVAALQGDDGVSLMSPFFAPSTASSTYNVASSSPTLKEASVLAKHNNNNNSNSHEGGRARTPTRFEDSKNVLSSSSSPPSHAGEVHNCAVCLEHLDMDHSENNRSVSSSILTTVCNHSFHLECLLQWQDSPCPVCRYDHSGLNEALSQCHICGSTEQNLVCLICGVVSCGSRAGASRPATEVGDEQGDACASQEDSQSTGAMSHGHARQHYKETLHAYALDTETQHVWDFVGQGYVHRLLQNAKDDKLVEVADPNNTSSYERSLSPGLSDAQEGEVVHRKLEGFASQYYTLLKSQLEQQRIYYEGRLEEIRREYGRGGSHGRRKKDRSASAELISALKQERNQLTQRCMTLRRRYNKVSEDVAFLKNMNESLEANKEPMKRQVMEAQRERTETRDMIQQCLPALEEKVTNLMLQLEESVDNEEEENRNGLGRAGRGFFGGDRKPAARK